MNDGKMITRMILFGLALFAAAVLLVVYLPIALYKDFRRSDDEQLPSWMGDVQGRKRRLAIILTLFVGAAVILAVLAIYSP
jgi:hypothetical protein